MRSIGQRIGERYELENEIGRGAAGSVYGARDLHLGRRVAIKQLHVDFLGSTEAVARFQREAWTIAQLRSQHVVQVFDCGLDSGEPYIVMELLEGETLEARLQRQRDGRLPLSQVGRIVTDVAKGLELIHRAGIVHRDVKPANVFIAREAQREVVKLLDFGIATSRLPPGPGAKDSSVVGTPQYMGPDQLRGQEANFRGDLWSLSVLTYELLTGQRPFQGETLTRLMASIASGSFPAPSSIVATLDGRVDAFFARAFALDAERRFQTAHEFLRELSAVLTTDVRRPIRILFLDDEPDMKLLLEQQFRRELKEGRYELFFALNGKAGLEELVRHPDIDVVLTDINMPELDGLSFLSQVPDVNPFVRVVMVTAYSDMANIRVAMNRGAFDFLCKPIDFRDLKVTIEKSAEHTARLREASQTREDNHIMRSMVGSALADRLLPAVRTAESLPVELYEASVVFIDVFGFRNVMAAHSADVAFGYLNSHFQVFISEVLGHQGVAARFIGDSVMALFSGENHVMRAVDACLSIRERLRHLEGWPTPAGAIPHAAVMGVALGTILAGGAGALSLGKLEQVVLGEPARAAAELQSRAARGQILVSRPVAERLRESHVFEPALGASPSQDPLGCALLVGRRTSAIPSSATSVVEEQDYTPYLPWATG
jgi:serine/threonine protein kinase/class 3 adenylate cyclase